MTRGKSTSPDAAAPRGRGAPRRRAPVGASAPSGSAVPAGGASPAARAARAEKASAAPSPGAAGRPDQPPDGPRGRNRAETTSRILAAVGEVLAQEGFSAIGVNAIARRAGVDKVLIYRYFGGLPELIAAWGESGRFWPPVQELLGNDADAFMALPLAERYARFFEHFVDGLRARPLTIEILAAELADRTELTAILETEREEWGEQAARLLGADAWEEQPVLRGTTLLLIAGVQYLLVRSRKIRVFGGLDIRSDRDWAGLKAAVRALAETLLAEPTVRSGNAASAATLR